MMLRDQLTLISFTKSHDQDGYNAKTETETVICAEKQSVRQTEFYQAQAQGVKLEVMFVIREPEYSGQTLVKYNNEKYKVERTYVKQNKMMEMVCRRYEGE